MKRGLKIVVAAAVLAAIGVGVELTVRSIAVDRIEALLEGDLAQALGAVVTVRELQLSLLPWPVLRARGLDAVDFPADSPLRELHFDQLRLGVAWRGLLRRSFQIRSLRVRGARVVVERGIAARGAAQPERLVADPGADPLDLEIRRLRIENLLVAYRDRQSGEVREVEFAFLEMHAPNLDAPVQIATSGTFEGGTFSLKGKLGSVAELRRAGHPYPVSLTGQLFEARIEMDGTVLHPAELSGLDLNLVAKLPSLEFEGKTLPDLRDLELRARLSDLDGSLGLDVHLETPSGNPVAFNVDGSVDDLANRSEIDVEAHGRAEDLDFLTPLAGPDLPDVEDVAVDARVSDASGKLALSGGARARALGGAITVEAQGDIKHLAAFREVDLHLVIRANHLESLARWLSWERGAPQYGPVDVRARLHDQHGALALDELRASVDHERAWVKAEGKIGHVRDLTGVDLAVAFHVVDSAELARSLGRDVPELGPLDGAAKITDRDGALGVEDVTLELGGRGPLRAKASGDFDDFWKRNEISADLQLEVADLALLGELVDRDWPALGPIRIAGHIEGSDERLNAENLELRSGQSEFRGSAVARFAPGARPSVRARLATAHMRLADVGIDPAAHAGTESAATSLPERLPLDRLRELDVDLDLRAERVTGTSGLQLRGTRSTLALHDGNFEFAEAATLPNGGSLHANAHIDTRTPRAAYEISLDGTGIVMGQFVAQLEDDTGEAGLLDLKVDLRAAGNTTPEIRQSLDGTVSAVLRDGVFATTFARRFLINLSGAVFRTFRPPRAPKVGCGVARLRVESGVAQVETLMLEGHSVTVTGSGQIDFVRDRFDLLLVPTAAKRDLVSVSPSVEVVGPLADPEFRPVRRTFATSLGRGVLRGVFDLATQPLRAVLPRSEVIEESRAACAKLGEY